MRTQGQWKKWEKFNSEKVAFFAYARIQDKANLASHFQSSRLMNEDKHCRPILLHSDGSEVGDQYWEKAEFPYEVVPKLASLCVAGRTIKGYGCPGLSSTGSAVAIAEVSRVDASCSTFILVHSLAMKNNGLSIRRRMERLLRTVLLCIVSVRYRIIMMS